MSENRKIDILGVKIDKINHHELLNLIERSLKGTSKVKIFTTNTDMISKARKNNDLKALLNKADVSIADGIGVVIASRLTGQALPSRLAGIEIGEEILNIAKRENYKIFLLGSTDENLKKAKSKLEDKYKSLEICGINNGFFNVESKENDNVVEIINESRADVLFVCMGFPRQEKWIVNNLPKLSSVKIAIGLGGSVDVWSGEVKRAPKFIRQIYLEWLWRILHDFKRAKFLTNIPYFLKEVLKQRRFFVKNDGKNAHISTNFNKNS